MVDYLASLAVTTPPNTPPGAPQLTSWAFPECVLSDLWVVIPDGHAGLTGVQIRIDQVVIVPWGGGWLVGNREQVHAPTERPVTVSGLVVASYNTDTIYRHTHRLRAGYSIPGPAAAPAADLMAPLPVGSIS